MIDWSGWLRGKRLQGAGHFLYSLSNRLEELITLKVSDKDKKAITVLGKGDRYRDILIPERLVEYLDVLRKESINRRIIYSLMNSEMHL